MNLRSRRRKSAHASQSARTHVRGYTIKTTTGLLRSHGTGELDRSASLSSRELSGLNNKGAMDAEKRAPPTNEGLPLKGDWLRPPIRCLFSASIAVQMGR